GERQSRRPAGRQVRRSRRLGPDGVLTTHRNGPGDQPFQETSMQRFKLRHALPIMAALMFAATVHAAEISGAGATFPYPVYAKWAEAYKQKTGVGLNYQSIGSGGGIKQIKAGTVTFGASDMPLKPDELKAAGLVQFPMIIGGVVPVVNLEGVAP